MSNAIIIGRICLVKLYPPLSFSITSTITLANFSNFLPEEELNSTHDLLCIIHKHNM